MSSDDGLVHVPTLPELHAERPAQAEVVERSKAGTFYRATPEGRARIDAAMRQNGEYLRTHPEVSQQRFKETLDKLRNSE